jgi:hypothetical protein
MMFKFLRKTALWIILSPLAIGFLGAGLNQAVLIANHDTFPVLVNTVKAEIFVAKATAQWHEAAGELGIDAPLPAGMIDDTHCLMTSKTHLNFLADIWDFKDGIYSVGDELIGLGEWSWTYAPLVWFVVVVGKLRKRED